MALSSRFQIVLSDELNDRLTRASDALGIAKSLLVRNALEGYLDFLQPRIDGAKDPAPKIPEAEAGKYFKE